MTHPINRSVAPLRLVRDAEPSSGARAMRDERVARMLSAPASGPQMREGSHRDLQVSVRVYAHGGSAVIARAENGGFDAVVR